MTYHFFRTFGEGKRLPGKPFYDDRLLWDDGDTMRTRPSTGDTTQREGSSHPAKEFLVHKPTGNRVHRR